MTLIGRTSVRTVLLTSFLLISAVLVVSTRTEDVATLEYDLGSLPATSERQPARLDTDASAADHRQGRKSLQTESLSMKAKREQMLRNILAARRRQILNQRSHDPPRLLSSHTSRPGDTTSKDFPDIFESQETKHSIYVTSARTESLIEEETSQSSKKSIEKITSIDLDSTELEIKLQSPKSPKEETLSALEKYESFSSSSITPTLTASTNQKSGDADTRKKNTVSMPEALYNHFRPVERNIPMEDMSQFLYFGQKLQPDAQNVTGSSSGSNNNSMETMSTMPTSSRRRYSTKRFSATIATPMEEIANDEMNVALERRTVEKDQVSRIKNMLRNSGSGLYTRKSRPTADVVSNIIPGNESSLVGGGGSDTRSEMNAVDDKFRRDDLSAHADTRTPRERGTATHVAEASATTQIPRQRQRDDEAETSVAESEISVKFTNAATVAASNGVAENPKINDFGKDKEKKEVITAQPETKKARETEGEVTGVERTTSTLRIVVPDDTSLELASFAIENERAHRNTVKQQPVEDPVADRPVRVSAGDDGDVDPKLLPISAASTTKEPSVSVVAVDSDQQPQQPHPQQHVYAYTITNVTRLLRNYTGPGLSDEEGRGGGGGGEGGDGAAAGRRAGSGAEITSGGGPSQQQEQERPPPPPPPPPQSSPLLLPRASIEPARASTGLSAGATVEPATAAGTSFSAVVGGLVGERPRKVVPQQQQQRATSQRSITIWSTPQPIANDNVTLSTRSVKLPETGSRGSIRWNHAKSRSSEQESANDRRYLRKSASAVLNQRSNVNDEPSSLAANKRRRVLASHSGLSTFNSNSRRVKSNDREKIENDKLVANDRSSNGTGIARRGKGVNDDEVPSIGSLQEVARASGVNEVPGDSSPSETTVMGNLNRNSSAINETMDATDSSILIDAIITTETSDVLAEEMITAPSVNDKDNIEEEKAEDAQDLVMSDKTSEANATADSVVATTVTVTERIDETVATTIMTTTKTTTTTTPMPTPPAPVFPVTPRILTEVEKAAVAPETFTSRPSDAAKAPEVSNLDPSEIQKRYRAKDATTTTTTMTTTMTTTTTTAPSIQNDTLLNGTSNRKPEMPASSTPTVMENGKRVSGERSPEVRARNLSDKSKDKDDVLPIMHLYNTSDIFNGSGPIDGYARGTERPRVMLPAEAGSQDEETPVTTTTTMTTTMTEKTPESTVTVTSPTEIGGSTSITVPIPKSKEPTAIPNPRKDKQEENRNSQDITASPVSKGSTFAPAANRTRYRPAYHSIPPEYNGTMYHPIGLNRTFFEADGPIAVSPRESLNISEVISKRHDGDVIATQETVAVVSYILATLVVFPIAVGVGLILRRLILRNRKVLEESDTSSEISCRKDALNLENGDFKTSIEKAITKLPRIQHLCHEAEKPPPPPSQESRWEFPRDKLRLQTVLGQGNFGQVWKAEADDLTGHQGTTRLVAVKTVKEGASDREKEDLDRELEIMKQLGSHPNVVTLLGCCTEEEPHYLILEYVMYGKLLAYLRDHRTRQYFYNFSEDSAALTSRDLTVFGYCVARGMEYLASKKIIHRDLAARNVLVDHNKLCKIADFGMSRFANEDGEVIETRHGRNALPIRWMAPESLIYSLFTTKTDVWSFGILMWEIVTLGSTPYPDMTAREVMRNVHNGYRLERPSHCRSELFRVIARCWHADPDRRPEFQTLRRDLAQLLEDNMNGHYVDLESFASECTD